MDLIHERHKCSAVVNAVMKLRISLNEGTFCTRRGTIRSSRKKLSSFQEELCSMKLVTV